MSNLFVEIGELAEEAQGAFAPETLPDGAIVYTRTFQREERPGEWRVLTLYVATVFPVDYDSLSDEPPEGYEVSEQWEEILCTNPADPGSSQLDSDYTYDWPYQTLFDSVEKANEEAKRFASIDHLGNLNYSIK
jgi:hypothetical protein